jgi:hypothetical protein
LAGDPQSGSPSGSASPAPRAGKSVSLQVHEADSPGEAIGVKALTPGETPGASSARLGSGQQSQVGAGLKFRFGKGAKPSPLPASDDDSDRNDHTP